MNEIIKTNYIEIPGAIDHVKFVAQQYFNKHGMSWKCVTSAQFVDGAISCEWEGISPVVDEFIDKRVVAEPDPLPPPTDRQGILDAIEENSKTSKKIDKFLDGKINISDDGEFRIPLNYATKNGKPPKRRGRKPKAK